MTHPFGPPSLADYIATRNAPDPEAETTHFAKADPTTGEIVATGRCSVPSVPKLAQFDGGLYLPSPEPVDATRSYVNLATSTIEPKTENPAFLEGTTLRNLPLDGMVVITCEADPFPRHFDITVPDVTIEPEHPGVYRIKVKSIRHLEAEFTIGAPVVDLGAP